MVCITVERLWRPAGSDSKVMSPCGYWVDVVSTQSAGSESGGLFFLSWVGLIQPVDVLTSKN